MTTRWSGPATFAGATVLRRPLTRSSSEIIRLLLEQYAAALPLMPGAREAVARLRTRFRLGLASSSHPELIRFALETGGLAPFFDARVSSDDVGGGKPRPDVYLRACELLGVPPEQAVAVEDSPGGLMAAHSAGMGAIAFPGPAFVLSPEVLSLAGATIDSLAQLTPELVLSARPTAAADSEGTHPHHGRARASAQGVEQCQRRRGAARRGHATDVVSDRWRVGGA